MYHAVDYVELLPQIIRFVLFEFAASGLFRSDFDISKSEGEVLPLGFAISELYNVVFETSLCWVHANKGLACLKVIASALNASAFSYLLNVCHLLESSKPSIIECKIAHVIIK